LGNQLFENGQLRFDTVYRFKGQQPPAIILTDVDPNQDQLADAERLLFRAMTRANGLSSDVLREGNSAAERLMSV
jgi:superfamily I DNA and RNA helicase